MIRKFGSIAAPPDRVRSLFSAVESWPLWMPEIQATRVLERSANRLTAEVDRGSRRSLRTTTLEVIFRDDGHVERQIKGPARRWEADWRFAEAMDGNGTVVSCRLDVDLGLVGFLVPRRTVQRAVDHTFERIVNGADSQLQSHGSDAEVSDSQSAVASRIQIFSTGGELEIWIDNQRYVAVAGD